jgi:hypothetical protein
VRFFVRHAIAPIAPHSEKQHTHQTANARFLGFQSPPPAIIAMADMARSLGQTHDASFRSFGALSGWYERRMVVG